MGDQHTVGSVKASNNYRILMKEFTRIHNWEILGIQIESKEVFDD